MVKSQVPKKQSSWYDGLYDEQRHAADFIVDQIIDGGGVALFSQQGTGKTHITLAILERLEPKLALIVAPLTSLDITWSDRLRTLPGMLLRSPQELTGSLGAKTLLIHPELLVKHAKRLSTLAWDIVIIDESQGIKDRNSLRSRAARRFRNARRRLALSGTPIDESQIDVWAQMRFVDHTVFGENWLDFAGEYCRKAGYMGKEWKFNKNKHEQFLKALGSRIYRLSIDFMKLKPLNLIPVPVVMLGDQARIYEEMSRHSIVTVDGHKITAPLAITRDVKKSQITGGFILDEDGNSFRVGYAKERKLKWLIQRLERPVVIFCQFLSELDDIVLKFRLLGLKVASLRGTIKGDERTQTIKDFQAGQYDMIVCQLRTGGVSIELSRSNNLVFYSFNHSYIDFEQVISRLHRGGQTREVNAWLLYCVGTIDEEKIDVVKSKKLVATKVLSPFEGVQRNG